MPAQASSMDTGPFLRLLSSQSHPDFVHLLDQKLQELNFKLVLKDLGPTLFNVEGDHASALDFVMQCLAYCQQHVGELSAGIRHLLLELIPAADAQAAGPEIKSAAVQLFHEYCSPQDAKLAAKVSALFKLRREDLTNWQHTTQAVQSMLASHSSYKAAVHLLMQFEELDEHIDKVEVITQLVTDGQENLAQQWVATLGRDYQITFIEACVALDRLKPAARAVRALGLTAEFPNLEALYRQRSLARLVGKRLWQVALSFVGNDTALQSQLVRDMVDAGELSLADEYRKQLGLPESVVAVDPAAVAAQELARREQYLQLDLHQGQLLFVDSAEGLAQAAELLSGSDVLGLDVEWKPSHVAGVASPAAILQLATRSSAVLFDLITLASSHSAALDACLSPLFASPEVLKLGFELSGDLAKLAGSWPDIAAFRSVAGVLDLRPLWVAYGLATRRQGSSVRLLSAVGLSTLCNALLGKPLDKSQQMSDWTARPLTQRQLQYAALDAYVLPKLFDKLCQELGPDKTKQLLRQHTTTVNRAAASRAGSLPIDSSLLEEEIESTAALLQPLNNWAWNGNNITGAGSDHSSSSSDDEQIREGGSSSNSSQQHQQQQQQPQQQPATASIAGDGGVAAESSMGAGTGEARILAFLRHRGFECTFRQLPTHHTAGPVLTACQTAAALGVPRAAVAKTMALMVDHEPLLVVTRGDQRVDMHKARSSATAAGTHSSSSSSHTANCTNHFVQVAALLGVRRRGVLMAPDNIVQQVTGFAAGGIPPIGHGSSVKVLVDYRLQNIAAVKTAAAIQAEDITAAVSCPLAQTTSVVSSSMPGARSAGWLTIPLQQQEQEHEEQQQEQSLSLPCRDVATVAAAAVQQLNCNLAAAAADCTVTNWGDSSLARSVSPTVAAAAAAAAAAVCESAPCSSSSASAQCSDALLDAPAGCSSSSTCPLYLQCGGSAVIQLTYQQLLELSGGSVADVANAPQDQQGPAARNTPAVAAAGGAANVTAAAGNSTSSVTMMQQQQQQSAAPQLSGGRQSAPCFLLDSMLGRLCRWLRALGVDAAFVESRPNRQQQQQQQEAGTLQQQQQVLDRQQQSQLIDLIHKAALSEGRLFLTRDSKLAARRDVGGSVYLLTTDDAAEQLTEISRHFGIRFNESTAMSRCSHCNAAAFQQISRDAAAAALVPAKVMQVVEEFWQCGSCGKVFWMGPKSYAAISLLEGLFTEGKTRPTPLQSLRPGYATAGAEGSAA